MSEENTIVKELLAKYGIKESPMNSSIGRGWENILDELLFKLKLINPSVKISQIKEKFGSLRVYTETADVTTRNLEVEACRDAETKSLTTCIVCSKKAKLGEFDSLIQVFCEECGKTFMKLKKMRNNWELIEKFYYNGKI